MFNFNARFYSENNKSNSVHTINSTLKRDFDKFDTFFKSKF